MSEPRSLLELRIRRLSARLPRRRWLGATAATFVATATIVAACETPHPVSPRLAAHADSIGTPAVNDLHARAIAESMAAEAARPPYHPDVLMYWTNYADTIRIRAERKAEDQPELLSGPELPSGTGELLGQAGIGGRVVVRAMVDPSGHAEPVSMQVIVSLHPAADQIAKTFMLGARFRPALVNGRPVRAPTELIVDFSPHGATAPSQLDEPASGYEPSFPDEKYLLRVARRYHPEAFTHPAPQTAVGLIFNGEHRLLAHAAGVREARDDGCLAVVQRLLPTYANRRWSSSGCADGADPLGRVVVYWMALR